MKKTIGFIAFWIAVGMLLMILISNRIVGCILIFTLLILGYNLFFCDH